MSKREMSVAGSFYPQTCSEIKRYLSSLGTKMKKDPVPIMARAIIVPHAGYVYSGLTANMAYDGIDTRKIKRVVIIGPSHRVYIRGASVALFDTYVSPCKEMKIDLQYCKALMNKYDFLGFEKTAHQEHSTEVQVPFIEHYFQDVELVEIVYGDIDYKDLIPLIDEVLADEENFLVISTDLSHFYDLKKANTLDEMCCKGVKNMDMFSLDNGCEACGIIGLKAVIEATKKRGMKSRLIDYRTSFDASLDGSRVVGYLSALVGVVCE